MIWIKARYVMMTLWNHILDQSKGKQSNSTSIHYYLIMNIPL